MKCSPAGFLQYFTFTATHLEIGSSSLCTELFPLSISTPLPKSGLHLGTWVFSVPLLSQLHNNSMESSSELQLKSRFEMDCLCPWLWFAEANTGIHSKNTNRWHHFYNGLYIISHPNTVHLSLNSMEPHLDLYVLFLFLLKVISYELTDFCCSEITTSNSIIAHICFTGEGKWTLLIQKHDILHVKGWQRVWCCHGMPLFVF